MIIIFNQGFTQLIKFDDSNRNLLYNAKVQGSRYICVLETESNQWYFRLKLDDVSEAEIPVTQMTDHGIKENIKDLFKMVQFQIHDFQLKLIQTTILNQIRHLMTNKKKGSSVTAGDNSDPLTSDLITKIDKIQKTLESFEARLERLEQLTSN